MLIRLIVKNLFSFKDYTEFNMLPGRSTRMPHHLYQTAGLALLKMNAMYGANGAGKSNMVRALELLRDFVKQGVLPLELITETFRFNPDSRLSDVYLGIEFIKDETPYYYGITLNQGVIIEEELQISGLGKREDRILFKRTDKVDQKQILVEFDQSVTNNPEASVFAPFLQNELLERNKPVLYDLRNRQNPVFEPFKKAFEWFSHDLIIITPSTKHGALALYMEKDSDFRAFALNMMKSFKTGVKAIEVETIPVEKFFGEDDKDKIDRFTADLKAKPDQFIQVHRPYDTVGLILDNNKVYAKQLYFLHEEDNGATRFNASEESDGTRRLLDYLPALYNAVHSKKVYVIDELERSIHPSLVKELTKKFSHDTTTKGQLIFTTHESNLLDQDIFRPDEIWFAEKKADGATELYVLSEFKEHHTIDIRKGYLNGRYGAIPFLGNLQDLKWDQYAKAQ